MAFRIGHAAARRLNHRATSVEILTVSVDPDTVSTRLSAPLAGFDTVGPTAIRVLDLARGKGVVLRLQMFIAGCGHLDYQVGSSGAVGPSFDASAFSEKLTADDRPAVFPRLRPALEVPHLYETAGLQRDKTRSAYLSHSLPR
ncbi:hypothetical protein [Actinoplanes xinjiangensis]|uniref:hypothetical protein n=1 Tax=Actinoplanes xinjiangensis TaxID=512350 RepID=UPI0011B7794F|nr:hypothetical protein [Actinoplanes xinjiangensis]GIF42357.1 hypothetical protein Axi01nite_66680 [Actinoplanes xinjiangensis]